VLTRSVARGSGSGTTREVVEGDADADAVVGVDVDVDGDLVVAPAQVLHANACSAAIVPIERIVFSPRIGGSRAFSRP